MHKFTKIAVSFLLIISIVLNPFGAVFDVRAGAIAPVVIEGIKFVITGLVEIAGKALGVYLGSEAVKAGAEAIYEAQEIANYSLSTLKNAIGVDLKPDIGEDGSIPYNPSLKAYQIEGVELTAEEQKFASYFINYVNSHPEEFTVSVTHPGTGEYSFVPTASDYERIKNVVTNSYFDYTLKQIAEKELDDSIVSMIEAGVLPTYDFNFVGPRPSISSSVTTGIASLQKEGFVFSPAISPSMLKDQKYFASESIAKSYISGFDLSYMSGSDETGYQPTIRVPNNSAYSAGMYILYNGEMYYRVDYQYNAAGSVSYSPSVWDPAGSFYLYNSASGVNLSSVYQDSDSYKFGFFYNKTSEVQASTPQAVSVSDDEFNQTIGGGTVELPRTEAEDIIGNAIGVGLLTPDSVLEIGEDGAITGADGITIAKLQELIDMLAEGNLQFENVQEYLDLITQLIGAGNLTATEQTAILENLKELEKTQAKSIEEINSAVTSIAAALAIEGEIDLEIPDVTVIDKFPFCLPFDLYYVFSLLCAEPKEPVFEVPLKATIETGGLNYEVDEKIVLDLTIFKLNGYDMVQIFTQTSSTLLFVVCLIGATKKLIWK